MNQRYNYKKYNVVTCKVYDKLSGTVIDDSDFKEKIIVRCNGFGHWIEFVGFYPKQAFDLWNEFNKREGGRKI